MNSRTLMTLRIAAAPPQKLGAVPHGVRSFVPVTGGDFEGPRLRGRILPGGGDWLLVRSDGVLELDLRITLETDDHALISMTFQGLRHGPPDVIACSRPGRGRRSCALLLSNASEVRDLGGGIHIPEPHRQRRSGGSSSGRSGPQDRRDPLTRLRRHVGTAVFGSKDLRASPRFPALRGLTGPPTGL